MKKKIPIFRSDEEAEAFVAHEDLSNYDLSGGKLVQFEFKPKSKSINIKVSDKEWIFPTSGVIFIWDI